MNWYNGWSDSWIWPTLTVTARTMAVYLIWVHCAALNEAALHVQGNIRLYSCPRAKKRNSALIGNRAAFLAVKNDCFLNFCGAGNIVRGHRTFPYNFLVGDRVFTRVQMVTIGELD